MTTPQIINAALIYGWLTAFLVFVILVWRNSTQLLSTLKAMSAVNMKNAESSERSAQAAKLAVETAKLLAEQLNQEKPPA